MESVVVHPDLRGKGFGKYLMLITEQFACEEKGFIEAYLCTIDRQIFYSRCGYTFCDPVCAYSGNIKLPSGLTASKPLWGGDPEPTAKKDTTRVKVSGIDSSVETKRNFPASYEGNDSNTKDVNTFAPSPVQIDNCDTQSNASKTEINDEAKLDINDVSDLSVLCSKLYCRPSFPCNPPHILTCPLRSLEKKKDQTKNVRKGEICRATIPKDYMKKKL